jgi:hypothetical protein
MKKIIIRACNIASVCRVTIDDVEQRYIYLKKGDIVLAEDHKEDTIPFDKLPIDVANEVEDHFNYLFAVPLEQRGKALADSSVVGIMKDVHCEADGLVETISLLVDTLHPDLSQDEQNELIHEEDGYLDSFKKEHKGDRTYIISLKPKHGLRCSTKYRYETNVAMLTISPPRGDYADYKVTTTRKVIL